MKRKYLRHVRQFWPLVILTVAMVVGLPFMAESAGRHHDGLIGLRGIKGHATDLEEDSIKALRSPASAQVAPTASKVLQSSAQSSSSQSSIDSEVGRVD